MPRYPDPVPELKERLAHEIVTLMAGWSQSYASWFMHVSRARVSEMRRGNLNNISLERLVQCATHLGRRVQLVTSRAEGPSIHEHWRLDGRTPASPSPRVIPKAAEYTW